MTDEPEKVDLETPDLAARNRAALVALFPEALADGVLDAVKLGELLGTPVVQAPDGRERYGLQWAGKREAVMSLLRPSHGTLIPDLDRSVDFNTAQNVFVEGDNLEVLKLLQKAYNDKVKLIYIDPPYNTGNDFIYDDDFIDGLRGYLEYSGQVDEEGRRVAANVETGGRRHSRWLSMMYPRLMLARNLLAQDGAIVVSIDFNEVAHLKLLMDEVFGEHNFQREIIWRIGWLSGYKTMANNFIRNHDTMLFYSRDPDKLAFVKKYINNPDFKPLIKKGSDLTAKLDELGFNSDKQRELLDFVNHENRPERYPLEDTWNSNEYDDLNRIAIVSFSGEKVSKLLGVNEEFKGQKSVKMLKRVIESMTRDDDVIMDFFAGSGSTAHAVLELNSADGGHRRCVSINIPEPISADSEAYLAGYKKVSDILVARILKVMKSIAGAQKMGLRVLRLAEGCFDADSAETDTLALTASTLRPSAPMDAVAAEIFLKEGVTLDEPWECEDLSGGRGSSYSSGGVTVIATLRLKEADFFNAFSRTPKPRVLVLLEDGLAGQDALKANSFTNAKNLGITLKTV